MKTNSTLLILCKNAILNSSEANMKLQQSYVNIFIRLSSTRKHCGNTKKKHWKNFIQMFVFLVTMFFFVFLQCFLVEE